MTIIATTQNKDFFKNLSSVNININHGRITSVRSAVKKKYNRPQIDYSSCLSITNGRHPVVEDLLPMGEDFIPNNLELDNKETQIAIITGPNMAGKSTYLRQLAHCIILAQIGYYVPATSFKLSPYKIPV